MRLSDLGRRDFLRSVSGALLASTSSPLGAQGGGQKPPNVVVIFADDLGYGDLGCFGSSIPTPNLDALAGEGVRLTRFYSASPVCSPARAALLTGRYPARTGIVNVLMPPDKNGLSPSENTLPKILKTRGYRTACVGKWHLGSRSGVMPCDHGFDEFYGLPYSNDMYPLPMMRNVDVVEHEPQQASLTEKFTESAVGFIKRQADAPFFLYFAHTAPHIPLVPSEVFRGKSGRGAYGDVVMELDWSVGQVLESLRRKDVERNTLVIFTSDNGPWFQGSAGPLQGRKGSTYEGGVREPFIARLPGAIPAGTVVGGVGSMMDIVPTVANLCGASVNAESLDGINIWPMLTGEQSYVERDPLLFFDRWSIQCVRWGPWKLHLTRYNSVAWTSEPPGGRRNLPLPQPELYHIDEDPSESYDCAAEHPQLVADLRKRVEQMLPSFPAEVRIAWRDALNERVQLTPVGALPARDGH